MTSDANIFFKPLKAYRRESADILTSGRVSGSPLITFAVMLVLCMVLTAASAQAAMILVETVIPLDTDSVPMWYSVLENVAAFIAAAFAAGPGWAHLGVLAGEMITARNYYTDSPEQPGYDLRRLLAPWKRKRYLRGVMTFAVLFLTYALPAVFVPVGYLCGRYIGWMMPRPFDGPAVLIVNAAAWAAGFAVQRLIAPLTMTSRFIGEEGLDPFSAVRKSVSCSKGSEREIFRMRAGFIGWALLSVVTCGIALIWTVPHYAVSVRLLDDEIIRERGKRYGADDLTAEAASAGGEKPDNTEKTDDKENPENNKDSQDAAEKDAAVTAEAENG